MKKLWIIAAAIFFTPFLAAAVSQTIDPTNVSITGGSITGITDLAIADGGTNTSSQTTNGVNYYNGTSITSGTGLTFNGTQLGIGTTSPAFRLSLGTTGTEFYVDSTGKIVGRDTTNDWNGRLSPTRSFVLETSTTTTWTASTTGSGYSPALVMPFAGTLRQMRCTSYAGASPGSFVGVNVKVNGSDATPSYVIASSTVGVIKFTAGNTFSAGQAILGNFGTSTTATATKVTCTLDVTENI